MSAKAKAPAKPTAQPTLDQFIDTMNRRKMFWEFHLGTIGASPLQTVAIAPAGPGSAVDFPVMLDGDSQSVTAQSLCGNLQQGQRVAVVFVPPSSYNIISILGAAQTNAILDAAICTGGTLAGPGTTATNIPAMELSTDVVAGRTYFISAQVFISGTVATDLWDINAVLNTTSGAGIGTASQLSGTAPLIGWPWIPTVSGSVNILFLFSRRSGTGTGTALGSPGAGIIRTWSKIEDVTSVWRSV